MKTTKLEWSIIVTIALLIVLLVVVAWISVNDRHDSDHAMRTGQCDHFSRGSNAMIECLLRRQERNLMKGTRQ